ncbi:hypothetical protein BDW59DRAFT_181310 [Aspergillus cavernicola]|uniref:Uncharacterized protein n=1 Tax=Aspergillus cavernicola TaxID=176166 RepID=A0ABR4HZQ1_9EURO
MQPTPDQDDKVFKWEWEWDLPLIFADVPDNKRSRFLLETITLTLSENAVKVLTCEQYIRDTYGEDGIGLVTDLLGALGRDDGKLDSPLWDLLMWLRLTLRQPEKGKICLSTYNSDGEATLQELSPKAGEDTCCWFSLFETAVIAKDPGLELGSDMYLETEFHLMLQLAAVEYPVMIDDGLVLMGYSTALVPMKMIDSQTVLWHLETARHDSQLKITELSATKGPWLKTAKLEDLQSKKALLGWCPKAVTLLGTGELGTVQWSDAKPKLSTWTWNGANLQFIATSTAPIQLGGQAGLTFERRLNTLRFSATSNYLKCLNNSATEQIVLYDVAESRAWLVPLICVLQEMLVVYYQRIPTQYRQGNVPLAKATSDGAAASLAVLRDIGGFVVEEGSGGNRLTIRDLILGFSINLSKTILRPPGRRDIYGYEFMDIITDSPKSHLKRTRVEKEGLAWISLLGRLDCLLCSGLGDAIHGLKANAVGSPCNQLPKGRDWLATSMHSIAALNSRHNSRYATSACGLSSQDYWLTTGTPFLNCEHKQGSQVSCWESSLLLQEIRTQSRHSGTPSM